MIILVFFPKLLIFSFPLKSGRLARKNSEYCEAMVLFVVKCWHICDETEHSGKGVSAVLLSNVRF